MNNGNYGGQFSPDMQALEQNGEGGDGMMGVLGHDGMMGGQSLDDMVRHSSKDAARRRSMPYGSSNNFAMDPNQRRVSLMDFGADQFNFDSTTSADMDAFMNSANAMAAGNDQLGGGDPSVPLGLNTQFANQNFGLPSSAYASPMHPSGNMEMDMASPLLNSQMPLSMDDPSMAGMMDTTSFYTSMPQQFNTSAISSPINPNFTSNSQMQQPVQNERRQSQTDVVEARASSNHTTPDLLSSRAPSTQSSHQHKSVTFGPDPAPMAAPASNGSGVKIPWAVPPGGFPSSMHGRPHMDTQYKDAYSSTGFDMLNILMRVATRPNPEINIGAVDLSCAFVVTDAEKDDNPIVYCSENFERLTGYTKHMILGRNCRFLQSPDGNVTAGIKRKYVDDDSVLYLKNMINARREAQISLINYRRGGQPFMNLLTMIPIAMNGPAIKFIVGFQVDLVEQPHAVTSKNSGAF